MKEKKLRRKMAFDEASTAQCPLLSLPEPVILPRPVPPEDLSHTDSVPHGL